jgi:hypothetical protein
MLENHLKITELELLFSGIAYYVKKVPLLESEYVNI